MSLSINLSTLNNETREQISSELEIKLENKYGIGPPKYVYPYTIINDNIILPFSYACKINGQRPKRDRFPSIDINFEGTLRPEQQLVRANALQCLSKTGSILCSMHVGWGKTACAINLSCSIKFKTLIIVNKIVLIKQWKESILKFCPKAKIQTLTAQSKKQDVDFYIINAQNTEKMGKSFFSDIGLCIVDEAHMIMAETLSRSLQYVYPRYLIGLTATPYRPDGLDQLLTFYFGKNKIIRKLHREHTVYKVSTNFKPPIEKTMQGRVNWGAILDAQANNEERNDLIVRIIQYFKERNFLVLVKRVEQGKYLVNKLKKCKESVTDLIGNIQEFDSNARILVGTCQKVGVGFDHSKLDTLLLATDLEEYFIQYLGRIFRTQDNTPLVFDIVDKNSILNKHFNTRRQVYQEHGGIIKDFDISILP
jgi:superfamily II DNA or RNA helicase